MGTNTTNLWIDLEGTALTLIENIPGHVLKRKWPGEHVLVTSQKNTETPILFDRVEYLDIELFKQMARHPLLGDECALEHFLQATQKLRSMRWTKIITPAASTSDALLCQSLNKDLVIGAYFTSQGHTCYEPLLKATVTALNDGDKALASIYFSKAMGLLNEEELITSLDTIYKLKSYPRDSFKNVLIGLAASAGWCEQNMHNIQLLSHLFTLVTKPRSDEERILKENHISFVSSENSWNREGMWFDLVIGDSYQYKKNLNLESITDSEVLAENISTIYDQNISRWMKHSHALVFCGQTKAAMMAEKMVHKYHAEQLKSAISQEIQSLKVLAKLLLDGIRTSGTEKGSNRLVTHLLQTSDVGSHIGKLAMTKHPYLAYPFNDEKDLLNYKATLREYNESLDRIMKVSFLGSISSDLSLTL